MKIKKLFYSIIAVVVHGFFVQAQSLDNLSFGTNTTFDLVTWNIENFPKNGTVTTTNVAAVIEALDADVIAIQEVDDITAFSQLLTSLPNYTGYLESDWFGGLAYIYKTDIVQINALYEIYTTSEYWSAFPRSPMVMDLNYMDERVIIINNHFKCCGDGLLDSTDSNDEETRRYLAMGLLHDYIVANFPDDKVIIVGDLNDSLIDTPQNNVFQLILDDSENYSFADYNIAIGSNTEWSFPTWPSHLDHILMTNELFYEYDNTDFAVQTIKVDDYLLGGWTTYDQNISDHRPVGIRLLLNNDLSINEPSIANNAFYAITKPLNNTIDFHFSRLTENTFIEIYNISGQLLKALPVQSGTTIATWNTSTISKGVYVAKLSLKAGYYTSIKLIIL